jgi:hypothetical protein
LSGWIEIRSPVSKPVQAALNEEDAMHYLALATDYKGTIADDGVVDKPTLVALVSVREQIESFEPVSGPLLNALIRLPFCGSCMDLGTPDVDQGEPPPL